MGEKRNNNQVTLTGEIVSNFEFSHETCGEGFYIAQLKSKRVSDNSDIVPIVVSERLVGVKEEWTGQYVKISGQFRSYNKREGERSRLILTVFVMDFETLSKDVASVVDDKNLIFLDGYIVKEPVYRKTPLGREIADVLIAANRPYGKSDYIPCICWGRNANFSAYLPVGTRLNVWGRIQSREYRKRISDDEYEARVAYEVSISKMEVIDDEQDED